MIWSVTYRDLTNILQLWRILNRCGQLIFAFTSHGSVVCCLALFKWSSPVDNPSWCIWNWKLSPRWRVVDKWLYLSIESSKIQRTTRATAGLRLTWDRNRGQCLSRCRRRNCAQHVLCRAWLGLRIDKIYFYWFQDLFQISIIYTRGLGSPSMSIFWIFYIGRVHL